MDAFDKPAAESAPTKRVDLTAEEFERVRSALDNYSCEYLRDVPKAERPAVEALLAKFGLSPV